MADSSVLPGGVVVAVQVGTDFTVLPGGAFLEDTASGGAPPTFKPYYAQNANQLIGN